MSRTAGPRPVLVTLLLAAVFIAAQAARADTVTLVSGKVVEGEIIEETPEKVVVKLKFGTITYTRNEIKSIVRAGDAPVSADARNWRDVVVMKNGEKHVGLIASEEGDEIVMDLVASGIEVSQTLKVQTTFSRREIADMQKLTDAQRAAARKYLRDAEAENELQEDFINKVIVDAVELPHWGKAGKKVSGWRTEMEHFVFDSALKEEFHRECSVRLIRMFDAYKRHFGVQRNPEFRVKVMIYGSMLDYYASIGFQFMNPAYYSPKDKQIRAGCDYAAYQNAVREIKDFLDRVIVVLEKMRGDLKRQQTENAHHVALMSRQIYKAGRTTPRGQALMEQLNAQKRQADLVLGAQRKKIQEVEDEVHLWKRKFDMVFDQYTKDMFETIYHEGTHAFIDNFLFSKEQAEMVPRWLHEGLAQYFEASRVDGKNLLLGQINRDLMAQLKEWQKAGKLKPVAALLEAGASGFIAHSNDDLERSAQHYYQSWAMVYVIADKGRLKREHLQAFMEALSADKKSQIAALPILTGMPNARFQEEVDKFLSYDFAARTSHHGSGPSGAHAEGGVAADTPAPVGATGEGAPASAEPGAMTAGAEKTAAPKLKSARDYYMAMETKLLKAEHVRFGYTVEADAPAGKSNVNGRVALSAPQKAFMLMDGKVSGQMMTSRLISDGNGFAYVIEMPGRNPHRQLTVAQQDYVAQVKGLFARTGMFATFYSVLPSPQSRRGPPPELDSYLKIGSFQKGEVETIDGKEAQEIAISIKLEGRTMLSRIWIEMGGLMPVKRITEIKDAGGTSTFTERFKDWQFGGPIEADTFALPVE